MPIITSRDKAINMLTARTCNACTKDNTNHPTETNNVGAGTIVTMLVLASLCLPIYTCIYLSLYTYIYIYEPASNITCLGCIHSDVRHSRIVFHVLFSGFGVSFLWTSRINFREANTENNACMKYYYIGNDGDFVANSYEYAYALE